MRAIENCPRRKVSRKPVGRGDRVFSHNARVFRCLANKFPTRHRTQPSEPMCTINFLASRALSPRDSVRRVVNRCRFCSSLFLTSSFVFPLLLRYLRGGDPRHENRIRTSRVSPAISSVRALNTKHRAHRGKFGNLGIPGHITPEMTNGRGGGPSLLARASLRKERRCVSEILTGHFCGIAVISGNLKLTSASRTDRYLSHQSSSRDLTIGSKKSRSVLFARGGIL